MQASVDLVVTCFERTYRKVLAPGFFDDVSKQSRFQFQRRIAVINNVDSRKDAHDLAQGLCNRGELDEFYFVDEQIASAYVQAGLSQTNFGRLSCYTDHLLVAATCSKGSQFLLHWDADVYLQHPSDWISPSLELMERSPEIFVANPAWESAVLDLEAETIRTEGPFSIGYGFSDQIFLVRRSEISQNIYSEFHLASMRYPWSQIGLIFEARVDSFMRNHARFRATFRDALYFHPATEGRAAIELTPEEQKIAAGINVLRSAVDFRLLGPATTNRGVLDRSDHPDDGQVF